MAAARRSGARGSIPTIVTGQSLPAPSALTHTITHKHMPLALLFLALRGELWPLPGGVEPGVRSPPSSLASPSQLERSMGCRITDDVAWISEDRARVRLLCRDDMARVKESSMERTAAEKGKGKRLVLFKNGF